MPLQSSELWSYATLFTGSTQLSSPVKVKVGPLASPRSSIQSECLSAQLLGPSAVRPLPPWPIQTSSLITADSGKSPFLQALCRPRLLLSLEDPSMVGQSTTRISHMFAILKLVCVAVSISDWTFLFRPAGSRECSASEFATPTNWLIPSSRFPPLSSDSIDQRPIDLAEYRTFLMVQFQPHRKSSVRNWASFCNPPSELASQPTILFTLL